MNKMKSLLVVCLGFSFALVASDPVAVPSGSEQFWIEPVCNAKILSLKNQQQAFLLKRSIVKYSLYGSAIIGAIFLAQYISNYKTNEYADRVIGAFGNQQRNQGEDGWVNWFKSMPNKVSTLFKMAVPAYIANEFLSYCGKKVKNAIADPIREESLYWFYYNHTDLTNLISVIKLHSVVLDPDSFYLNYETNQMSQKVALQEFMQEVKAVVSGDDGFFKSFLPQKITRQHIRQAKFLNGLEDDALINEGIKQANRFVADKNRAHEAGQSYFSRKIIRSFVFKMKSDIEKLLAFALARYSVLAIDNDMIQQLISLTNRYIEEVEMLLNLSDEEMTIASQEKRGLFTKTFVFTKRFNDSLKTLNVCLNW